MKKFLLAAASAALAIAATGAANAQAGKTPAAVVVVIDTSRISQQCTACVGATGQLQALVTSGQQRAQQLGTPLQTEAQAIQTQAQTNAAMPAGAAKTAADNSLKARAQAFDQRQQAAQQEIQRLEQNIQSVRANVQRQIGEKLNPIISQVMTAHGANLAVDVEATLAHAPAVDVTNEVLAALNTQLPSVSVTPLPQAPAPAQPQGR